MSKPTVETPSIVIEDFVMNHLSEDFNEEFTKEIPPVQIIDRMPPGEHRNAVLNFFKKAWNKL